MKLAPESHRKFETFFRQLYGDERFKLPPIRFYAGNFSRLLTKTLKIYGITVGGFVFVKPKFLAVADDKRTKIHVELAAHEIAHVLQYKREGFIKFLWKYFGDYHRNLRRAGSRSAEARLEAYLEIPFEIEAREIASKFVEWNERNRKQKVENGK